VAAAYRVDITSNWLGMICDMTGFDGTGRELSFNFAALSGLQTWIVLIVGTGSAFIEHVMDLTIRMVAGHVRQAKDAKTWLVENGYLEDEDGPTRRPSRGDSPRGHARPPGRPSSRPPREFGDRPTPRGRTM